jgi:hypothetical protein
LLIEALPTGVFSAATKTATHKTPQNASVIFIFLTLFGFERNPSCTLTLI